MSIKCCLCISCICPCWLKRLLERPGNCQACSSDQDSPHGDSASQCAGFTHTHMCIASLFGCLNAFIHQCTLAPAVLMVATQIGLEPNNAWHLVATVCRNALAAYQEALAYAPNNNIAMQRMDYCKTRVERLGL